MDNLFLCITRIACFAMGALGSLSLFGGFTVNLKENSLRELAPGLYEIDGFVSTNANPPASPEIVRLLLNLNMSPADGVTPINGIIFAGIRSPVGANVLFPNPEPPSFDNQSIPDEMFASVSNASSVPAPSGEKLAFVLTLFSTNPNTVAITIGHTPFNFYEGNTVEKPGETDQFALAFSQPTTGALSITGVPEPSTYVLTGVAFGVIGFLRRRARRRSIEAGLSATNS